MTDSDQSAITDLILALLLGCIIGAERQWHHRTAGLKTNALVSLGTASFIALGHSFTSEDAMARIAAQIISGIGFLGAGVILREGLNVRGLNTAATLWCSSAVGALVAMGATPIAYAATALILFINLGLQPLVERINRQPNRDTLRETRYEIILSCRQKTETAQATRRMLLARIADLAVGFDSLSSGWVAETGMIDIILRLRLPRRNDQAIEDLIAPFLANPDIVTARWTIEGIVE